MSSRGPKSSQVGLFSTQISEQIVRLRALRSGAESSTENQSVELRRAVMATRLLAGSARILNFPLLPQFLDELLGWLQGLEKSSKTLSTTQTLILESVIELEESLMLEFDEDEAGAETELEPFRDQIEDLLALIHRDQSGSRGKKKRKAKEESEDAPGPEEEPVQAVAEDETEELVAEADEGDGAFSEPEPDEAEEPDALEIGEVVEEEIAEAELSDVLELTQEELQRALERVSQQPEDLASLWDEVAELVGSVQSQLDSFARQGRDAVAFRTLEQQDPTRGPAIDDPGADAVLARAYDRLRQTVVPGKTALVFRGYGGQEVVHASMREATARLVADLAGDIAASIEQSADPGMNSYHVSIELRADEGAVHVVLSDDAPRSDRGAVFGETDHLALLAGLRRARVTLTEMGGLIRVEPEDSPQQRYAFTLPLDPERPRYTVFRFEEHQVAVPSTLMEGMIPTAGLLYTSDLNGASFEWAGRQIPLVDLSHFVSTVSPPDAMAPQLAVFGTVEKRLSLPCDGIMELHEAPDLVEAPAEWRRIASDAFEVDGEVVPVLDVPRLLRLRFRLLEEGALDDEAMEEPGLDTYVPVEEPEAPPKGGRAATRATAKRVLLVNQSEFRRKDLSRTLQGMGFTVTVSEDLNFVSEHIAEEGVELLVTDLRLGKEGSGSLKSLRKEHPDLTIILTSSVAGQYADELARKTGANHIWLDPYRKSDLLAILGTLEV